MMILLRKQHTQSLVTENSNDCPQVKALGMRRETTGFTSVEIHNQDKETNSHKHTCLEPVDILPM